MDFGEGGVWILSRDRSCLGFALMRFSGVRMGQVRCNFFWRHGYFPSIFFVG